MTLPHDPATGRRPGVARHHTRCPASWPILGCSSVLLAGAVALVLSGKASVTFLVTFVASTAILFLLIAESGHGLLALTVRRGLAHLHELGSPRAQPGLRGAVARRRHPRIIGRGSPLTRRHT